MTWVVRGNLKGPTGTIDAATAVVRPSGSIPSVKLTGSPAHRSIEFGIPAGPEGKQGIPGLENVPTDPGVAQLLRLPSETRTAMLENIEDEAVTKVKQVEGGQFLGPVRVPTLTVEKAWPDRNVDYRVLWAENSGETLYALGYDLTIRKSVDGGKSWVKKGTQGFGTADTGAFLKTTAGSLLMMRPGTTALFMRSVDDGVTWATVVPSPASKAAHYAMGSQSWAIDRITGYIYYGEYSTADNQASVLVYRSTDDGATFTQFHAFPATGSTSADKVRHIHSIQWDHIAGRIVVMTGDSSPASGMYRVDAAGTALEPLLLNRDIPHILDGARAIGIIPFPDYLCWTGDSTGNPYLMRMARSEIGKPAPVVERVYRLNSTGWFTCRASNDGSRWVFSASQEAASTLDLSAHLYAVEDQGATVYEIGALPVGPAGLPALSPLGTPESHGDVFFLQGHNVGTRRPSWRMRLAQGTTRIDWPQERPTAYGWQTISSGSIDVPAAGAKIFGHAKVAATALKLHVLDAGVVAHSGDAAAVRVQIRVKGNATPIFSTVNASERAFTRQEGGGPIVSLDVTAQDVLEFHVLSLGTSGAYTGTAYVTYGFGY